jgi:hypothetical protein
MVLHKLADGVYWAEDADGLPTALATTLDDGVTSLKAAEQWWAASQRLLDPALDALIIRLHSETASRRSARSGSAATTACAISLIAHARSASLAICWARCSARSESVGMRA